MLIAEIAVQKLSCATLGQGSAYFKIESRFSGLHRVSTLQISPPESGRLPSLLP